MVYHLSTPCLFFPLEQFTYIYSCTIRFLPMVSWYLAILLQLMNQVWLGNQKLWVSMANLLVAQFLWQISWLFHTYLCWWFMDITFRFTRIKRNPSWCLAAKLQMAMVLCWWVCYLEWFYNIWSWALLFFCHRSEHCFHYLFCLPFVLLFMFKMTWLHTYVFHLSNTKVTGVGTNTEWGQLMANLSEDNGEETPLQVNFCSWLCLFLDEWNSDILIYFYGCRPSYNYGVGALEWRCNFYWYGGFDSGWCCTCSPLDKVSKLDNLASTNVLFITIFHLQIFYWTYQGSGWHYSICGWNHSGKKRIYGGNQNFDNCCM